MLRRNVHILHIGGQEISWTAHCCYLGSIIHEGGGIEEDMIHKIKAG